MSEYVWKEREAVTEQNSDPEKIKKVLVLYTGGTIGMKWTKEGSYSKLANYDVWCSNTPIRLLFFSPLIGYQIDSKCLEDKVKIYPGLCDPDYHIDKEKDWMHMGAFSPIPLPYVCPLLWFHDIF